LLIVDVVMSNVADVEMRPTSQRILFVVDVDGHTAQILRTSLSTFIDTRYVDVHLRSVRVRVIYHNPLRYAVCTISHTDTTTVCTGKRPIIFSFIFLV